MAALNQAAAAGLLCLEGEGEGDESGAGAAVEHFPQLGQTKLPKPSGCFGGSPFKKRETLGNV